MSYDVMNTCANLILSGAIEDFAAENNISIGEARHQIFSSRACESLYNFNTKLWGEGPDYFLAFYEDVEKNDVRQRSK